MGLPPFSTVLLLKLGILLRIPRIQGGQEMTFMGTAQLTSTTRRQVWARPPIDVDFQVLMFTSSGLIVRFLKVFEKSNYHSIKWVRYLTKASGGYQIRVSSLSICPVLTAETPRSFELVYICTLYLISPEHFRLLKAILLCCILLVLIWNAYTQGLAV